MIENFFSQSLYFFIESFPQCALRESGYRIGYEPTKMNQDHFWRLMSRNTNLEVSALSPSLYWKTALDWVLSMCVQCLCPQSYF